MKSNATVFSVDDAVIPAAKFAIVREPKNKPMADESDNPLSEYVREVMRENDLSAETVSKNAKRAGARIARATVQQIVSGATPNPGIHTLNALALGIKQPLEVLLAKALGRPIGELKGGASGDFGNLADLFDQLPAAEQRGVRRYYLQALEREMRRILTRLAGSD